MREPEYFGWSSAPPTRAPFPIRQPSAIFADQQRNDASQILRPSAITDASPSIAIATPLARAKRNFHHSFGFSQVFGLPPGILVFFRISNQLSRPPVSAIFVIGCSCWPRASPGSLSDQGESERSGDAAAAFASASPVQQVRQRRNRMDRRF